MEGTKMKKTLTTLLTVALVAGAFALPADAKKKKPKKPVKVERVAQGTYTAPATVVGNCTQTDGVGCMTIPAGPEESYITAKVTDDSGQPVLVSVQADLNGDAQSDTTYGVFCGETVEPIQVDPGVALIFWVSPLASTADRAGCAPGQGTAGTLDVTFSNMP